MTDSKECVKNFLSNDLPGLLIFLGAPTLMLINQIATADQRAAEAALKAAADADRHAQTMLLADCQITFGDNIYHAAAAQGDGFSNIYLAKPVFKESANDQEWVESSVEKITADNLEDTQIIEALTSSLADNPACQP